MVPFNALILTLLESFFFLEFLHFRKIFLMQSTLIWERSRAKAGETKILDKHGARYRHVSSLAIDRTSPLSRREARSVAHPAARQSISLTFSHRAKNRKRYTPHTRTHVTSARNFLNGTRHTRSVQSRSLPSLGITIPVRERLLRHVTSTGASSLLPHPCRRRRRYVASFGYVHVSR